MKAKKLISLGLAAVLSLSIMACGGNAGADTNGDAQGENTQNEAAQGEADGEEAGAEEVAVEQVNIAAVTELQAGENTLFVCYPENNASDTLGVSTTCTSPVFFVFGEGKYDQESAKAYATESGLAAIAAKEGSSVVIVNPIGDTWSEADAAAYSTVVGLVSDDSASERANGITSSLNYFTQEMENKITGTTGRVYVYGIGAGADFALANIVKEISGEVTYPDGNTIVFNNTIAGATLKGLSDASTVENSDIPVVSVGNSEEINKALEAAVGSLTVADAADYAAQYEEVIGNNRRQAGVLLPVHDWEAEGIVETIETSTVTTSADNVTFAGTENHEVSYVTYYAKDLDVANGKVPLVLCFHGGGNTALYEAQATEWPLIGKENGFITVSVDLHYPNMTATEVVELIDILKEKYSIDASRIYASGFSMGGCKSWDLYEQYPEVFAGLAPMDASFEPGQDSFDVAVAEPNTDTIVPVFYVGGEESPLAELPCQDEKLVNRVKNLFTVNQVTKAYDVSFEAMDSWENPIWGVNGDETYTVEDTKAFLDSVLTVETFNSADGNCYTALASASNQSHEVYARNSWAAWDFLSKFSRAEDGSVVIAE